MLTQTFGANVDRGMRAKGLTNRDVGKIMDRSEMEISRWRRGLHLPVPANQAALADILFDGDLGELYKPAKNGRKPTA